jgi:hypothetical protein
MGELTSALDGSEWPASRPGYFTAGEIAPGTRWIGGCMGTRAGLAAVKKRKSCYAGNRTTALQPVDIMSGLCRLPKICAPCEILTLKEMHTILTFPH